MKRYKNYIFIILVLLLNLTLIFRLDRVVFEDGFNNINRNVLLSFLSDDELINNDFEYKYIDDISTCNFIDDTELKKIKVDIQKPVIQYKKVITTTEGVKVNLLKNVKVTDNADDYIVPTVEGDYDINTVGEYKLKYVAVDNSNNKTEESFVLKVKEKVITEPTIKLTSNQVSVPANGTIRQKMVSIAKSQVGNVNGNPYWSWYGFKGRVAWCATFVSWVANEAGALNTYIPKFAGVGTGYSYFSKKGQIRNKSYIPSPGDIIFFDWGNKGRAGHVGIVEKVEGGKVFVIEGNTNKNMVENKSYALNHKNIHSYAVPSY